MAKSNLPSVDAKSSQPIGIATADSVQQPDGSHLVEVQSEGYAARMVDVRMTGSQPHKFKQILRHLEDSAERLADGSYVNNNRRAVLWLIENFEIPSR